MTKAKTAKQTDVADEAEEKAKAKAKKAKAPAESKASAGKAEKKEKAEPKKAAAKTASPKAAAPAKDAKKPAKSKTADPDDETEEQNDLDEIEEPEEIEEDDIDALEPEDIESEEEPQVSEEIELEERPSVKRKTISVTATPQLGEPKPAVAFSNSGLGVRTAPKKPVLSVAPGVMILGRPAAAKTESPTRQSERRLSKKELGEIKSFLMEKRERLLAGMRRELAMQRERAENKAADEVDKATDAYDEDLSFEIATANDQELEDIQVALEKIERGTYGECEICGCTISPSRLKILPSATTCVSCRGQEELTRRREESPAFNMLGGEEPEGETSEP